MPENTRDGEQRTEFGAIVQSPDGSVYNLAPGERASVGRAGDIVLGRDDQWLHGEVFELSVSDDGRSWGISVPPGKHLDVDVLRDGEPQWSIPPGHSQGSSLASAELRVRTSLSVHRLMVTFTPPPIQDATPTTTKQPEQVLFPSNSEHRALIVACRDRVRDRQAHALSTQEIAAILGITFDAAAARLKRAYREIEGWMADAGVPYRPGEPRFRDEAVNWLVGIGSVTTEAVDAALQAETAARARQARR